jgi:putative addiction module component (TIGR02574 family)
MKTKNLISEALSLPVEQRALVVDSLLQSLNATDPDIDRQWAKLAEKRFTELKKCKVQAVPGDQVFAALRRRFDL